MLTYTRLGVLTGIAALTLLGVSCQKPATGDSAPNAIATFDLIQQTILTPSCASSGCHASEQDAAFAQHGLVLAAGKAYDNLVGVDPKNSDAKTDGLKRVQAFASATSLLYYKIDPSASHHTGQQYGNPMPLGGNTLSNGQIDFVRRWIEAGAPRMGSVVDVSVLDDKTTTTTAWEPLPVPATGTGYQMALTPFDVPANFEREFFTRRMMGNTQDVYVNRYQIKMRSGSHHFLAYDFRNKSQLPVLNDIRDLRNADNSLNLTTALTMSNHVYLAGAQAPSVDYTLPEGAALLIPAGASFDLNSHYVNKTSSVMTGEAQINFFTVDKSKVQHVAQTLDLNNTSLSIPANSRVTLTKSFMVSKPRKILTLTSHMHKLGEKFVIKIKGGSRDGQVVYTSTDWEHPDIVSFLTPLALAVGEGLTSEITYNNTTAKLVTFGLTSDDEMGIIFGYYYED